MNKVILIGHLGRAPESRTTGGGTTVVTLSLATSERRKDRDGNWTDHTEWHRVVCFGRTAENAAKHLRKGSQLAVDGRLQTRKWQDKDGNDRFTTEVVADEVRFLGKREGSGGGGRTDDGYGEGAGYGGQSSYDDDPIPF